VHWYRIACGLATLVLLVCLGVAATLVRGFWLPSVIFSSPTSSDLWQGIFTCVGVLLAFYLDRKWEQHLTWLAYLRQIDSARWELSAVRAFARRIRKTLKAAPANARGLPALSSLATLNASAGLRNYGSYPLVLAIQALLSSIQALAPLLDANRSAPQSDRTRLIAGSLKRLITLASWIQRDIDATLKEAKYAWVRTPQEEAKLTELKALLKPSGGETSG
jgi:hypothetical protein